MPEPRYYHVDVETMRMIEWARSYNWAVKFDHKDTPSEFREWFPATDISYDILLIQKQDFDLGVGAIDFPKSTSVPSVRMTCIDGGKSNKGGRAKGSDAGPNLNVLKLHKWIEDWANEIVKLDRGVLTLEEACRPIEIIHYNSLSNKIGRAAYAVYPHGEVSFTGNSEATPSQLEITFSIAGVLLPKGIGN